MFSLFKKKRLEPPRLPEPYDRLFGDVPLEHWKRLADAPTQGPWATFDEARAALSGRDKQRAKQLLSQLLEDTSLESWQVLQAWRFLRELGVQPQAAEAKRVLGVVVEVGLENGNDTLAAYRDYGARYISHTGKLIAKESRDPQLDAYIDQLLAAGQRVAEKIGPWNESRRAAPSNGNVRLSLLTPSGLHCSEGSFSALVRDPLAGPVVTTTAKLMGAMIGRASQTG